MLEAAGVTSSTRSFLPKLTGCINLFLGFGPFGGQGAFLVKKGTLVTSLTVPFQEVIADTFGARRPTLLGA